MHKTLIYFSLLSLLAAFEWVHAKPNIVLFFVDDLGWNNLNYRNPSLFETPNINQLAREGLDFQQCYVASPTCSPSRSNLVTGKHPARLRMVRHVNVNPKSTKLIYDEQGRNSHHLLTTDPAQFPSKQWVDLEHVTYAEALKELGYYNLFLGKWHIGSKAFHPIHQGFDRQIGTTDRGAPSSYYPAYFKDEDVFEEEPDKYLTDKLTDELVEFIEDWDGEQPFMASLWYYNVHTPNQGRKDLLPLFRDRAGLQDGKRVDYAAQVMAMDESVGRVRAALNAKGIDDNTVILFTSDQGSFYEWEPYRGGKRIDQLFEGGARVPLIVSWPGFTTGGSQNDSVVQTTDIFPTLVEMAGGNPGKYDDLDGVSLLSIIKSNRLLDRGEPIYGYRAYEDLYISVREENWKLLGYRSGKLELFNVVKDRSEQKNLVEKQPKRVQRMLEQLKAFEFEMGVERYSGFKEDV
jgi:arylsulfatase A-like enzyme